MSFAFYNGTYAQMPRSGYGLKNPGTAKPFAKSGGNLANPSQELADESEDEWMVSGPG